MRQDPFGRPMAATVSASRGSARRPVRKSSFLSAMSAVPRPHLRADPASGHLCRAIARAAGARRPGRCETPRRSASSASSPAPSTRQERRARSTIAANVGSTMPSRARRTAEAERGTRQDLTSTTGALPSRSASRAARPSDVVFQSREMLRSPSTSFIGSHTGTRDCAIARRIPASVSAGCRRACMAHSIMPVWCMASTAMRCAAASENPCSTWAARTTSAKVPPPGTITTGEPRPADHLQDRGDAAALGEAAAELDNRWPAGRAHGTRGRTISTPTASGPRSSFSTRTSTETMRLSSRQRSAMRAASVSTRLM